MSNDSKKSSDSETSSSEDETISNVSLNRGINPCKYCTSEDCDLRKFCLAIGITEVIFWLSFTLLMFFFALLTIDSEPVVVRATETPPAYTRRHVVTEEVAEDKDRKVRKFGERKVGHPGGGSGDKRKYIEADFDDDFEDHETTTLETTSIIFEELIQSRLGDAAFLLKPDTEEGMENWQRNIEVYLPIIGLTYVVLVSVSIVAGSLCVKGAASMKKLPLILHTVGAGICCLLCIGLAALFGLLRGVSQAVACTAAAGVYVYFGICSYGLHTVIKAGTYDDFEYDGITYTYSSVLKARVKTSQGEDGHPKTVHPNG